MMAHAKQGKKKEQEKKKRQGDTVLRINKPHKEKLNTENCERLCI
jgi:hypothetical protein